MHAMDVDDDPRCIFWKAVVTDNLDLVKESLARGASINTNSGGLIALHYAAKDGSYAMCTLLIDEGADINAKNRSGVTPLMSAVSGTNTESIHEICKLFIAHKADVNARNNNERTALMLSAQYRYNYDFAGYQVPVNASKLLIKAIAGQTPREQQPTTIALFSILKNKGHGRDMSKMITQELKAQQWQKYRENKEQAKAQIVKIANEEIKPELLDYLDSL